MALTAGQRSAMLARSLNGRDNARSCDDELAPSITRGMTVKAADRENFGRVVAVEGGQARVFFQAPDGAQAQVWLPLEWLSPVGRR